jgi:pyridoxal phosphate enzyme (YggS family)
VLRAQRQGSLEILDCLCRCDAGASDANVIVNFGIVGTQPQSFLELADGPGGIPDPVQQQTKIDASVGEFRFSVDGLSIEISRARKIVGPGRNTAKMEQRFRMSGFNRDGLAKSLFCTRHILQSKMDMCDVVPISGFGSSRDGLSNQVDSLLVSPRLVGDKPQEMECIRITWVGPQPATIEFRGFRQFARPMKCQSLLQDRRNHLLPNPGLATRRRPLQFSRVPNVRSSDRANSSNIIAQNLAMVWERVGASARSAGRDPAGITLVAVAKTHPAARIELALAAGQRVFGENRVQEAAAKWPALKQAWPDIELHLVGPLQTNKARDAVTLFDVIESLDRPKLAQVLATEMTRSGRRPACYVQVNTGEEPQKAGIVPTEVDEFIRHCRADLGLPVAGLMCIPPVDEEPSLHFALLRKIAQRNGITVLSMGMSADYEIAIAFGATHVRVGTAIFGERPVSPSPA